MVSLPLCSPPSSSSCLPLYCTAMAAIAAAGVDDAAAGPAAAAAADCTEMEERVRCLWFVCDSDAVLLSSHGVTVEVRTSSSRSSAVAAAKMERNSCTTAALASPIISGLFMHKIRHRGLLLECKRMRSTLSDAGFSTRAKDVETHWVCARTRLQLCALPHCGWSERSETDSCWPVVGAVM